MAPCMLLILQEHLPRSELERLPSSELEPLICSNKPFPLLSVASNLVVVNQCFGGANFFHL
jgi:hypothetical protein